MVFSILINMTIYGLYYVIVIFIGYINVQQISKAKKVLRKVSLVTRSQIYSVCCMVSNNRNLICNNRLV